MRHQAAIITAFPAFPTAQDLGTRRVYWTSRRLQWTGFPDADRQRTMDDSDEALMALVARGDEPAFRVLSRRHLPVMLGLARRILGNAADAEDVAQEAMLRVWIHAPRWQPLAAFRTWLTRITVNLCLDRKRRAPWVELEAAGEIVDPAPDAGAQVELGERERLVTQAVEKLPARQRAAIMLTYSEGMSNAQVAEILDTSVSAVETLLVRGKHNLRGALGRVIDED
ncbi:MAG TPA: RNA polymerase sigma factor [Pseudolabrys sp.]|jgi:RNA polymerase sigma-70 factor (ECF subfamily)|nr:RNA polymerase sigma factor [Pseudolabrys sp.]